jgi:hypothetical protein
MFGDLRQHGKLAVNEAKSLCEKVDLSLDVVEA